MTAENSDYIHDLGRCEPGELYKFTFDEYLRNAAIRFVDGKEQFPVTGPDIFRVKAKLSREFSLVAPDLSSLGLADGHAERLIKHLLNEKQVKTRGEFLIEGAREFYNVSRYVLGPIWADYIDTALQSARGGETFLFAARDATPFYFLATGMTDYAKSRYNLSDSRFVHVDWNRWFMGQEDELDASGLPLNIANNSMLKAFYLQMGFGNGRKVKIIEPGAWGSAANALKTMMPTQDFELWFLYSHMPDRIYGHLNAKANGFNPKLFELINDTGEALPKPYLRPDKLTTVQRNGSTIVVADLTDKVLNSPLMRVWSMAVNKGAYDAGVDFVRGQSTDFVKQVKLVEGLKSKAEQGMWSGVLPHNTLTWTEGEQWVKNWQWGRIPPLK